MPQAEECLSLQTVKERQDKTEEKLNSHGERITSLETTMKVFVVPGIEEIKSKLDKVSENVSSGNERLSTALTTIKDLHNQSLQEEPVKKNSLLDFALEIFKDMVKAAIIAVALWAMYSASKL